MRGNQTVLALGRFWAGKRGSIVSALERDGITQDDLTELPLEFRKALERVLHAENSLQRLLVDVLSEQSRGAG